MKARPRLVAAAAAVIAAMLPAGHSLAAARYQNPVDLGTLGGTTSQPVGISQTFVVGNSALADGSTHAFAYSLANPSAGLRDLGTLGGTWSTAAAISGSIVVGSSALSDGTQHAFALNLATPAAPMLDLGYGAATAVDNGTVVGWTRATTPQGWKEVPFAYNLNNPGPGMQVLPWTALFLDLASATAVSGHFVAGDAHYDAWVYDLNHPTIPPQEIGERPTHVVAADHGVFVGSSWSPMIYAANDPNASMLLLGNFNNAQYGTALAVSGKLVVGYTEISRPDVGPYPEHAFVYDLSHPGAGKLDIGTLGTSTDSEATAVNAAGVVAGVSGDRAFAYDASDPAAGLTDLGALAGGTSSAVSISPQGVIAGWSTTSDGATHAVIWLPGTTH